jgi:cytochrome c oxidase accessory protein FixG
MFAGPFVRVQGNPLLLLNFIERKFVILGRVFWPQDMIISAVTLLIFCTGIIVFTVAFGRLWCGWTCPQTILMEMVFRKIEYFIEGDSWHQRALAKAPWSAGKIIKKLTKHSIFFGLSFVVGNTLLAYLIGTDQLFKLVTDNPAKHLQGLGFMLLFTLVFYAIFARFREQACTFICPYGRLQSTLLDENSIIVAYDYKRGEQRAPLRRSAIAPNPKGIASSSPGLSRTAGSYPGFHVRNSHQPRRGCAAARRALLPHIPLFPLDKGHNSFGVAVRTRRLPRVARASRPWALWRNPFGILHLWFPF